MVSLCEGSRQNATLTIYVMNVERTPGVRLLQIHNLSYVCMDITASECSSVPVSMYHFVKVQTGKNFLRWLQSKLATHRTFEPTAQASRICRREQRSVINEHFDTDLSCYGMFYSSHLQVALRYGEGGCGLGTTGVHKGAGVIAHRHLPGLICVAM